MAIWSGWNWLSPESPTFCDNVKACPLIIKNQDTMKQMQLWHEQLEKQKKELENQASELACRQEALNREFAHLSRWEETLQSREYAFQEAQKDARQKENQLLQTAYERYQQERALWEAALPTKNNPSSGIEDGLEEIKKAFMAINTELKQTRENLLLLDDTVGRKSRDGIAELCRLYREMAFSQDTRCLALLNQLGAILQAKFYAEPLEPCPGDMYDPACHERMDASHPGEQISICRARGWSWKGEILLRAVVETKERTEHE